MRSQWKIKTSNPLGEEYFDSSIEIKDKQIKIDIFEHRGSISLLGTIENGIIKATGTTDTPIRADLYMDASMTDKTLSGNAKIGPFCSFEIYGEKIDVSL